MDTNFVVGDQLFGINCVTGGKILGNLLWNYDISLIFIRKSCNGGGCKLYTCFFAGASCDVPIFQGKPTWRDKWTKSKNACVAILTLPPIINDPIVRETRLGKIPEPFCNVHDYGRKYNIIYCKNFLHQCCACPG